MPDRIVVIAQTDVSLARVRTFAERSRPDCAIAPGAIETWHPLDQPDLMFEDQVRSAIDIIVPMADAIDTPACAHRLIIIADDLHPDRLNAAKETGAWSLTDDWNTLVAMLILIFPEAHWVFHNFASPAPAHIDAAHNPDVLKSPRLPDPLLDCSGLRNLVREQTNVQLQRLNLEKLPLRQKLAASIDEEIDYACFHAYTAYRFGCRADIITDWRSMTHRFPPAATGSPAPTAHAYWLILEDMNLNFSDRPAVGHLANLETGRASVFPNLDSRNATLETSHLRVLITSGRTGADRALADVNRAYLEQKAVGKGRRVYKPASGMFHLWRQANGAPMLRKGLDYADGFQWPPPTVRSGARTLFHGSVGKLQMIAEILVARAEAVSAEHVTLPRTLRGAVWATDALELTCLLTPTLSTHALNLKHRLEVVAECQFAGLEHHIDVARRLHEIKRDSANIASRVAVSRFGLAWSNTELRVLNGLVITMRENNLFDEEQQCTARARQLHNWISYSRRPHTWLVWMIFAYIQRLLRSPFRLVMALIFWIVVLTLLFTLVGGHTDWREGLSAAVSSFFSIGAPIHSNAVNDTDVRTLWYVLIINISIMLGFVHLGVFIAHLYTLTMRR